MYKSLAKFCRDQRRFPSLYHLWQRNATVSHCICVTKELTYPNISISQTRMSSNQHLLSLVRPVLVSRYMCIPQRVHKNKSRCMLMDKKKKGQTSSCPMKRTHDFFHLLSWIKVFLWCFWDLSDLQSGNSWYIVWHFNSSPLNAPKKTWSFQSFAFFIYIYVIYLDFLHVKITLKNYLNIHPFLLEPFFTRKKKTGSLPPWNRQ